MRRHWSKQIFAVAFCLLLALSAFAGPKNFWETKPYNEWTEKEVENLLLKDSPWTRTQLVGPPPTSVQVGSTSTGGGRSSGPESEKIIINWYASPIRKAVARQMMLRNPETPPAQLEKILQYRPQHLELLVSGLQVGAARGRAAGGNEELEKFKAETYLEKKNKEKIPLLGIVMPRGRDQAMTLQFAREVDGKPTVALEDQEVTLVIRIRDSSYKFKYKLADMVVGGNLET